MQIEQRPTTPAISGAAAWRDSGAKLLLIAAFAVFLAGLILFHIDGINGTPGFLWLYRRVAGSRIYPAMLLAAVPSFLAQFLFFRRNPTRPGRILICMMLSTLAMELVVVGTPAKSFDINRIVKIVQDPITTSYFTDAQLVAANPPIWRWLQIYDSVTFTFTLHSKEKPPGPVLYYVIFLRILGLDNSGFAALLGGLSIGLLATLSVPATFWFVRLLTGDVHAALAAAGFFSLSPCLVLFFPMFDQIYPVATCLILGFWILALRDGRIWASAAFGAVLALILFFSYVQLVLGAFVVLYSIVYIAHHRRTGIVRFIFHAAIGLGVVVLAYVLLWLLSGFDPIATFRMALFHQSKLLANLMFPRPYPQGIPSDFQDFFLGTAWISLPLLIYWFLRQCRADPSQKDRPAVREFVLLGLAQIVIVGITGLLPGETARVWMFLQPLALVPIGLELSRWNPWHRIGLFALLWFLTAVMAQNMVFVTVPAG